MHRKVDRSSPCPKTLRLTRDQVRGALDIPARHFLERGFSRAVIDSHDVGYSAKLKRVLVPLYDDEGVYCIGYTVRSIKPPCGACRKHHDPWVPCGWGQKKWGIMEGFPKRSYLYNYAAALRTGSSRIFLVEGPPDVWRLAEAGYVGVALLDGQHRKLAALGKEVLIALDNDPQGRAATGKLRAARLDFRCEYFPIPRPYKNFGDVPVSVLREAIRSR